MYKLNLDIRSPYRYVANFWGKPNGLQGQGSYFSVEIQALEHAAGASPLNNNIKFSIEVCVIEEPDIMKYYTLISREYCQSVPRKLSEILTKYNVIESGCPFVLAFAWNGNERDYIQLKEGAFSYV